MMLSRVQIFRPTTTVEMLVNSQVMMRILGPVFVSPSGGGCIDEDMIEIQRFKEMGKRSSCKQKGE